MGASSSSSSSSVDKPDKDYDHVRSDKIKSMIHDIDKSRSFKKFVDEVTPSVTASKFEAELDKASDISGASYAPSPTYIDYSIFGEDFTNPWGGNDTILKFSESEFCEIDDLSSCLGSIYGMCIADSWGHLLEFVPVQYDKVIITKLDEGNFKAPGVLNRFRLKAGQYTDDSSMGLCLADNLLVCGHVKCPDLRKRFTMWWYLGYNNAFRYDQQIRDNKSWYGRSVGLGGQISYSLKCFIEDPKSSYAVGPEDMSGNGSIMRLCPVPIFYRNSDIDLLVSESMKQSFATHSGIQSAECAALLSFVIVKAIKSTDKTGKEFLDNLDMAPILSHLHADASDAIKAIAMSKQNETWIEDKYNKVPLDQYWNWKDEGYRYSPTRSALTPGYVGGYACDNLAMALHCVYQTECFESAVLRCINRCGDADTVGSVTGQIAGALYGLSSIPASALECLMKWDPKAEIPHRVFKMFKIV